MKNLIGNTWKSSQTSDYVEVRNPYNNMILDTVPNSDYDDINEAVKLANKAKKYWLGLSINERSEIILKFSDVVKKERFELAKLLTSETGKNIQESEEELDSLISLTTAFVEKARHMYGDVIPAGLDDQNDNTIQITSREPIGVIAAMLPFNFPVISFAHKVPAALIMGNTVIVKPSSKAPLTITKLAYLLRTVGIPEGVIQVIHGTGEKAGHNLAMHPDIELITFSGTTPNGIKVMEAASTNLTRVLLELGGNDAMIVCKDANIDLAIEEAIKGRLYNMGQSSSSTKRFLVHKDRKTEFVNGLLRKVSSMRYGNPMDTSNTLACLIDEEAAMKVDEQVKKLEEAGARVILGGRRNKNYYEPTIVVDVTVEMGVSTNVEIMGPVIPIIEFDDINTAIEIVNSSPYGLASSIFTNDIKTAFKATKCLETGTVIINGSTNYRSNEMAYGGWKYSGFGTEGVSSTLEQLSLVKTTVLKNVLE
ncbi:MAG: aldehyde dehydrogenase [Bacilli bacterium]|nr:aldehyde dehydrogenase [Bacilli bacterium]